MAQSKGACWLLCRQAAGTPPATPQQQPPPAVPGSADTSASSVERWCDGESEITVREHQGQVLEVSEGVSRQERRLLENGAGRLFVALSRPEELTVPCIAKHCLYSSGPNHSALLNAQVTGEARVALPAEVLFALLTHPASERIFRHLERCDHRRGSPG